MFYGFTLDDKDAISINAGQLCVAGKRNNINAAVLNPGGK